MENGTIRDALEYMTELGREIEEPRQIEIAGKVYCTKNLTRYDKEEMANSLSAKTLTALVDYIKNSSHELRENMIVHIIDPCHVKLISGLTKERNRECLMDVSTNPAGFQFDNYYDQEGFIINLQASFKPTEDLKLILQVAGNVENKATANYGDDGITQKTVIKKGIAAKENVIVPNPVILEPYRTFLEVAQPQSEFVFRIKENERTGEPNFKLVAADGGLWKYEAVESMKEYFQKEIGDMKNITVIG